MMSLEKLDKLIKTGREIEFEYKDKKYSITYYPDNREKYISFCEFNQEPIDFSSAYELWNYPFDGTTLGCIIGSIPYEQYWIY